MRKVPLVNDAYYHIYNRGVDKRKIVNDKSDSERFITSLIEFNSIDPVGSLYRKNLKINQEKRNLRGPTSQLVDIVAYCLNPNHYHLILKQKADNGISEFIKRVAGGYTLYFNEKNKRSGVLFQGKFKSAHINTDDHLNYLSVYVNLNDKRHNLRGRTSQLVRSSWNEYLEKSQNSHDICSGKNDVLKQFNSVSEYKKYAKKAITEIIDMRNKGKDIRKIIIE